MAKKSVTAKHKDLGIFYTDPAIADFIYSIINVWKNDEDIKTKRWQSHIDNEGTSDPHYPSVIDPAVGEGVFLKEALEQGFTDIHHIFGLDLDADAVEKWKQIHLLKAFGGNEKDLEAHFFNQNGLDKIKWQQHAHKYYKHLKKEDIKNQQFNLVIGNPPYGGTGLDIETEPEEFIDYLREYEILPDEIKKELGDKSLTQTGLFTEDKITLGNTEKASKRLKSYPIEILFIERFLKLAKPDGWVAIVLPEGIFANSNSHYVREYIAEKAKVEAIVSLPRDAFKNVGTTAKTSIMFLRKYGKKIKRNTDYPIFLASTPNISKESFGFITKQFIEYYGGNMTKLISTLNNDDTTESVMVRVDKKLSDLMGCLKTNNLQWSRWDVHYWGLNYEKVINELTKSTYSLTTLDKIRISEITQGYKGAVAYTVSGLPILTVTNIEESGINITARIKYAEKNGIMDVARSRLNYGDILIVRSGSIGRAAIVDENSLIGSNILGDTYIIKKTMINNFYLLLYLKTKYGQSQLHRLKNGVGVEHLASEEIDTIIIPLLEESVQEEFEHKYIDLVTNKRVGGNTIEAIKNQNILIKDLEARINNAAPKA